MRVFSLLDKGLVDYREIDLLQRRIHADVIEGKIESTLIVAQFEDVYTAGSKTKIEHLCGLDNVIKVDRGGSVTWHGRGQLVIYPVVKLVDPENVILYIRTVEKAVLSALRSSFGLDVETIDGKAGVWLKDPDRKICAIGLKVANGVTLHGLALNINPDLSAFSKIIPCGLYDSGVTSLQAEGVFSSLGECEKILTCSLVDFLSDITV